MIAIQRRSSFERAYTIIHLLYRSSLAIHLVGMRYVLHFHHKAQHEAFDTRRQASVGWQSVTYQEPIPKVCQIRLKNRFCHTPDLVNLVPQKVR